MEQDWQNVPTQQLRQTAGQLLPEYSVCVLSGSLDRHHRNQRFYSEYKLRPSCETPKEPGTQGGSPGFISGVKTSGCMAVAGYVTPATATAK